MLFTGEMIYPWMFENDPLLAPLAEAAEILARRDAWPRLYDAGRLRANDVPAAAAVCAGPDGARPRPIRPGRAPGQPNRPSGGGWWPTGSTP